MSLELGETMDIRLALIATSSVLATLAAVPSLAQAQTKAPPAPNSGPGDSGAMLSEVVVTAERHETKLLKLPAAVSAYTGAQRDVTGISTIQDVSNFTPGFSYDTQLILPNIRGIQRESINLTLDSRVATYEDGMFVIAPYNLGMSSLFLSQEQIERGPQNVGGRNAEGGSIDMIFVRPTDTPDAEVRASLGNYSAYNVEGAVSGPVAPNVDLRLAGFYNDQEDGYDRNLAGFPSERGAIREWYLQGQAVIRPDSNSELYVKAYAEDWENRGNAGGRPGPTIGSWDETNLTDSGFGAGSVFVNPNYGYAAIVPSAAAGHNPADPLPISVTLANPGVLNNPSTSNPYNFSQIGTRRSTLRNFDNLDYDYVYHFGDVDFTYTGGINGFDNSTTLPFGESGVTSFTLPGSSAASPATLAGLGLPGPSTLVIHPLALADLAYDTWNVSQEADLKSTGNGPLQWTLGGYYFFTHYSEDISFTAPDQPNLTSPDAIVPFLGGNLSPAAPNPRRDLLIENYAFRAQSEAVYAQAYYRLSDQWRITGNIRYTADQKTGTEQFRAVAFSSSFIDALSPLYGAATPSFDETPLAICPTGNPSSCASGPLAPGVKSLGVVQANGVATRSLAGNSGAVTGGAGVEWTPTSDIFIYARYGRGYESASFNAGGISADPEVSPEYINAYEVGYKQSFGRSLSIDTALYYYDYTGFQVPVSIVNAVGANLSEFVNVPNAEAAGFEFEGTWSPVRDLVLTASYSYDHTEILTGCSGSVAAGKLRAAPGSLCIIDSNDPDAVAAGAKPFPGQTPNGAVAQSVRGNPLPDAPLNKFAINAAYTWHFDPGRLTVSGTFAWRDTQDATLFDRYYDNTPSWSDTDFRAVWASNGNRYQVIAYVKNAFDTLQYPSASAAHALRGNDTTTTSAANGLFYEQVLELNPPRTFGIEVRYKFF